MADIAILVAEEYERRTRNSMKGSPEKEIDLISWFSLWGRRLDVFSWVNFRTGEQKLELAMKALEPRSQFGLAILHGFISA